MNSLEEELLNIKNLIIEDIYKANNFSGVVINPENAYRCKVMLSLASLRKHFIKLFDKDDDTFGDLAECIKSHHNILYLDSKDHWCNAVFNFSLIRNTFESRNSELQKNVFDVLIYNNKMPKYDSIIEFEFDVVSMSEKTPMLLTIPAHAFLNTKSLSEQRRISSYGQNQILFGAFSNKQTIDDSVSNIFSLKSEDENLTKLVQNLWKSKSFFDFLLVIMYRPDMPTRESMLKNYKNFDHIKRFSSKSMLESFLEKNSEERLFYFNFNLRKDEARTSFVKDIFELISLRTAKISGNAIAKEYENENLNAEYMTDPEYLSLKFDIEDLTSNINEMMSKLNEKQIQISNLKKQKSVLISLDAKREALKEVGFSQHKFRKIKSKIPLLK